MIPTAATNVVSTQTASSATIGICSLILEGRALSDDEFVVTSNFKRHVLHNPPGYITRANINITTNPSADLASATTSSTTLFKTLTVSTGCGGASTTTSAIPATSAVAPSVSTAASDATLQHYQRLRQKLTQLRQSSPSTSLEPYPTGEQKIIVGGPTGSASTAASSPDPENPFGEDNQNEIVLPRFLPRRSSNAGIGGSSSGGGGGGFIAIASNSSSSSGSGGNISGGLLTGQSQINQSSDNNILYTLQSLATTCLWTSTPRTFGRNHRDYTDQQQSNLYTACNNTLETSKFFVSPPNIGGNNSSISSNCSRTSTSNSNSNISNNQNKIDSDKNNITVPPKQGPHCDQFLKKLGMMSSKINNCHSKSNITSTNKILDYEEHICDMTNLNEVCYHWQIHCRQIEVMLSRSDPICIEVYLGPENHEILLEQWIIEVLDTPTTPSMTLQALCNAIRSQLYFSQITAWTDLIKKLHPYDKEIIENGRVKTSYSSMLLNNKKPRLDIYYRIKPYDSTASFNSKPILHNFPNVVISDNCAISVCLKSLPRLQNGIPKIDESTAYSTTTYNTTIQQIPLIGIPLHQNSNSQEINLMTNQINEFGSNNNINNGCSSSGSSGVIHTTNNMELLYSTTPAPSSSDCNLGESMLLDDRLDIPCQEKGKHKCAYDDDDDDDDDEEEACSSDNYGEFSSNGAGGCDQHIINNGNSNIVGGNNSNNVSHRERQLMKYRKRMMKRDRKKKLPEQSHILMLEQQNIQNNSTNRNVTIVGSSSGSSSSSNSSCSSSSSSSSSCSVINGSNNKNNCQLTENFSNGCNNVNNESTYVEQPEFGSINSMRPPLYQTATHSITESVQTQCVEMISIGTQTNSPSNTNDSSSQPNCDQCNNEMTFVCLNCCDVTMKNQTDNCNCHIDVNAKSICEKLQHTQQQQQQQQRPPQTLCKADLLLQAIQRTPKNGNSKFNNNNNNNYNNNNSSANYRKYDIGDNFRDSSGASTSNNDATLNDCQLCKRQKTQHSYKSSNNDNFANNNNNKNNNNCCTLKGKCTLNKTNFGNMIKCNCSSTATTLENLTVRMEDDDVDSVNNTDYGNTKILATAIQNTTNNLNILITANNNDENCTPSNSNNNNNILSNNNDIITPIKKSELGLNISSTISPISLYNDITAQFKTPKSGYLSPKNQNYNHLNINNNNNNNNSSTEKCISSMKKALPKINLSNVFCNQLLSPSSTTSLSSSSPIPIAANNLSEKQNSNNINLSSSSIKTIKPPEIPVQKSNSAPTLPNSPSLSPRFIKQASIYKRRSRHLSDRSDRSSLGSDEQLSDEDLDSFGFSPAGSPIKSKFFARLSSAFGRRPLLGNLEESLLQKRFVPKTQVAGFKVLLGASGGFCPTQLTIPASAYFYELDGQSLSTPYLCEIRLARKGYTIPRFGTVQATLLNPFGTVVRMFVIPYDLRDMPPMNQTFIRQRILAVDSEPSIDMENSTGDSSTIRNGICNGSSDSGTSAGGSVQHFTKEQMRSLRYSIHLRFQTSRSGRLALHTDIRFLISRRTDCDTAAAHAKGALESPNELKILTQQPDNPKYSARQETNPNKI